MFSSDNKIGGFNNDVLNASIPNNPESCISLIDEIKNRAKGAISNGNYPGAIKLYTKGMKLFLGYYAIHYII
jgi:hypothetical protein